jgi:2-polyprenyl-6-methoxyphenol hydroxylase-like FAD-dependent oxidoreductase
MVIPAMTVEYTCLLGVASGVPGLEHSPDMHVTYGNGQTFQIITQPDVTCFLVYRKLPQPIRGSARMKYTQEDADREAAFFADSHITETVLFRHIYERRFRGQLVNVEEGIFDHWHHGRLALMGDAAHKVSILSSPHGRRHPAAWLTNSLGHTRWRQISLLEETPLWKTLRLFRIRSIKLWKIRPRAR